MNNDPNAPNTPVVVLPETQTTVALPPLGPVAPHAPRPGLLVLCPHKLVDSVLDINPLDLRARGIMNVIIDLDNTLVRWQQEDMTAEVTQWVEAILALDFKLCVLSNSPLGTRSERIANRFNSLHVRNARKPGRQGFERALSLMGTTPHMTAMVGDQIFTDIWGGNRMGIYTILVKPIHRREFFYTRIVSRPPERLLLSYFRRRGLL